MSKLKGNAHWAALVAVVLSLAAVTFTVTDEPTPTGGHQKTYTFKVDRSVAPGVQPATITAPAQTPANTPQDATTPLAVAPPAIVQAVPRQIAAANAAEQQIKATLPPLPTAGAAISVPGCKTLFIHSFSGRHGVRPVQFWLHYAAMRDNGWKGVLAVVHFFTTVQASSHFVLDRKGDCAYIVPIEQKAWTQMAANAFGINFEVTDLGNEATYMEPAGYKKLASILSYLSRVTGIPIQKGGVSGCAPTRPGIVTHWMGGLCSGGHVDLRPFNIDHEIAVLRSYMGHPKPAKKVMWIRHRKAVHLLYVTRCPRRHRATAECGSLRLRARVLDGLIARR